MFVVDLFLLLAFSIYLGTNWDKLDDQFSACPNNKLKVHFRGQYHYKLIT